MADGDRPDPPTHELGGPLPSARQGDLFARGAVLAERFRIVRFLAEGGMGEVYEAEDLELSGRLALKTVRPSIASDARSLERFRREIQLARRITHPNVSRVFDVFRHKDGERTVTFLTMELLSGETVADRLKARGAMTTSEALPLVAQMAAGLDAAHRAGVVHRDFKSANVMLVPENGGVRAVVTDFGLARATRDAADAGITGQSETLGSPAYMAPEQVEGSAVGAPADLYALGVVVYEMVTGTWPFSGDTPIAVALKRLREPPPPPSSRIAGLDPRWNDAILKCLARDPHSRFPTGAAFVDALTNERTVIFPAAPDVAARSRVKQVLPWGIGAVAVALTLLFLSKPFTPGLPPAAGTAARAPRRSFAILGFRNASGKPETAWLSTALTEMLATELAAGEAMRSVPGETVAKTKLDLGLAEAESYGKDTLARLRATLGADVVVVGAYTDLGVAAGGPVRLDIRLQETRSGETLASVAVSGTESALFDLVERAGSSLRSKLGEGAVSAADAARVRASLPEGARAAALYAEGLTRLRRLEATAARESLEKAVSLEPKHPLIHSALSLAYSTLGFDARAAEEAKAALDLSEGVDRAARLSIEARVHETRLDFSKAADAWRALWEFFPDEAEYGLRLADAQRLAGKASDALDTIDEIRKRRLAAENEPRLDIAEARAAGATSDYKRQAAAAARGVRNATALGARLLRAEALLLQGSALLTLGQAPASVAACDEAQRAFSEAGDLSSAASALDAAASALYAQGDVGAARKRNGEALTLFRRVGNRRGIAQTLNSLAGLARDEGDFARAGSLYREAIDLHRETGNKKGLAVGLNNLASLLDVEGDVPAAERLLTESIDLYRELGNRGGAAGVENNLALLRKKSGDLAGAKKLFEESLAFVKEAGDQESVVLTKDNLALLLLWQGDVAGAESLQEGALADARRLSVKSLVADGLSNLAEIRIAKGDLAGARRALDEALSLRVALGEKSSEAETRLAFARLFLQEGNPEKAETEGRVALEAFRKENATELEAAAHLHLARVALAKGRADTAGKELDAAALFAKGTDVAARLAFATAKARFDAEVGRRDAALASLKASEAEATRLGLSLVAAEARRAAERVRAKP